MSRKKALTQAQSVLALSLLTDVINGVRPGVTFLINQNGELEELSTRKVLQEQRPTAPQSKPRLKDYLK